MIRYAWLAALLAVGACTSFDDITRDVCGNGLVEPGEDCDSNDPSCVRCAVTCTSSVECPSTDYVCGVDGVCHAPSGALDTPLPAGPFQVADAVITDLDKDGIGDVFGVSRTSISVRYGDPAAKLTRTDSLSTPSHSGAPGFGDIDNDGALDLVAPTDDGLIAYTSKLGLSPLTVGAPIANAAMGTVDARYMLKLNRFAFGALVFADSGAYIFVFDLQLAVLGFNGQFAGAVCPGLTEAAFAPALVDVYNVSDADTVVSLASTGAQPQLCVVALHHPLLSWSITSITPANAAAPSKRPVLADLDDDNDACPDLVNTDDGAAMLRHWSGSMTASNGCALQAAASPAGAALPAIPGGAGTVAVGRVPIVPAIATLAPDLLATNAGLYAYNPAGAGEFISIYTAQRQIARTGFADLDGDGQVDGVLVPASEDDLDILYRRPSTYLPLFPAYLLSRVDTASTVLDIEIGDFDGNDRPDVAYLEQLTGYQRMMVSYATADALAPPVMVGSFQAVSSIASAAIPTSEDSGGFTEDLLVVQPPLAGQSASTLTQLQGSALRTMFAYFDPRFDPDAGDATPSQKATTRWRSIVLGHFGGDAAVDTFGIAVGDPTLAWRLDGTPYGPDASERMGLPTSGFSDCTGAHDGLCVADAAYLPWRVSDDKDVVIAVDRGATPRAVSFDPGAATVATTDLPAIADKLPADAVVRSLHAADLDGDDAPELVVAAAPRQAGDGSGAIVVCAMDGAAPASCDDLVPAIRAAVSTADEPLTSCVDAAPARVTPGGPLVEPTPGVDLVALCHIANSSVLYRVRRAAGGALDVTQLARTSSRLEAIRIGDVTGDGVDDVLAIEGEGGAQALVVFPQCDARDAGTCRRSTASLGGGS